MVTGPYLLARLPNAGADEQVQASLLCMLRRLPRERPAIGTARLAAGLPNPCYGWVLARSAAVLWSLVLLWPFVAYSCAVPVDGGREQLKLRRALPLVEDTGGGYGGEGSLEIRGRFHGSTRIRAEPLGSPPATPMLESVYDGVCYYSAVACSPRKDTLQR